MSIETIAKNILLENGCPLDIYCDSDIEVIENDLKRRYGETFLFDEYSMFDIAQEIMEISCVSSSLFEPVYSVFGEMLTSDGEMIPVMSGEETESFVEAQDAVYELYRELAKQVKQENWKSVCKYWNYYVVYGEKDEPTEREVFWKISSEELEKIGKEWNK